MKPELLEAYKKALAFHDEWHILLIRLRKLVEQSCKTPEEAADACYVLRSARDLLGDSRSNTNQFYDHATKLACLLWTKVQMSLPTDEQGKPIRTEYIESASPNVGEAVNLPPKTSPEYAELCAHFGVRPGVEDVVSFHWPSLMAYIDQQAEEGKPLPKALEGQRRYNTYKLTIRSKKGLLE